MPKKTKKTLKVQPQIEKPKAQTSDFLFWSLVAAASLVVINLAIFTVRHNVKSLQAGAGSDISGVKEEIGKAFEKLSENLQGVKELSSQTVEPVQAFKQNVLEELKSQEALGSNEQNEETVKVVAPAWSDFLGRYGFRLQHPSDWNIQESKVADWFEVSLSKSGVAEVLKISNLPLNLKYKVGSTSQLILGDITFKKVLYADENATAHLQVEKGKYKGYYILYSTKNEENNQLFEQILETLRFD